MLGGGQSKQAVIKSRISAMTAVFMVLLQRTQPFPHPLFSMPKANFHTSAGLLYCCKVAESHCVCVCVHMCVLLKPLASLRLIKKIVEKPAKAELASNNGGDLKNHVWGNTNLILIMGYNNSEAVVHTCKYF